MISEKCTKGNNKINDKSNHDDTITLSFFTTPFIFIFLTDCNYFINNNFFEFFYKCMKINDKEHVMKIFLSNSNKWINNKNIIISYIFKLIKINIYDKLYDNVYSDNIYITCDRIFINIKIIFFFSYLSYYLFDSLSLEKCEDNVVLIKNFKDEIEESQQDIELNSSSNDNISKKITEQIGKNVDPYYDMSNKWIENIMSSKLLTFLKSFLNDANKKNVNEIDSENGFEDIIMHINFSKDLFNLIYDKRNCFYYLSAINVNLYHNSEEDVDNDYNFETHKIIQELLNNFEINIDIINFKELTELPVRKILVLFFLSIFRILYNGNILKSLSLKFENGDIKKYLIFLNYFIFFNYFVSYLSEEVKLATSKHFSCSTYYTISFLLDIILCFYGIGEHVEKMEEFPEYSELKRKENSKNENSKNEIFMEIRNELKILNNKLKHTIEELSNKGKKYIFPQTEILINKI
ncbi:hypothetical protein [Plasmodium yoelii yoelii]|uniref:Uncharacterized protein n=1 Tax=Plasmodium yoelii yoelii TaxID=73239 RepID=Q7RIE9_PLAYO|nr:hypothetical protein [Plasmodium yoelii yoelii]